MDVCRERQLWIAFTSRFGSGDSGWKRLAPGFAEPRRCRFSVRSSQRRSGPSVRGEAGTLLKVDHTRICDSGRDEKLVFLVVDERLITKPPYQAVELARGVNMTPFAHQRMCAPFPWFESRSMTTGKSEKSEKRHGQARCRDDNGGGREASRFQDRPARSILDRRRYPGIAHLGSILILSEHLFPGWGESLGIPSLPAPMLVLDETK
jgi:hypothetical protein